MTALLFLLIVFPFAAAICIYFLRVDSIRSFIVILTSAILMAASFLLFNHVPFTASPDVFYRINLHTVVQIADVLLLFLFLYFGFKFRSLLIILLSLIQIAFVGYLELFLIKEGEPYPTIYCDHLSLIMVLIISVVGSIICIQGIPYMKNHEHHLKIGVSAQPRFFFVMILFLGAMNGLVLSNDMVYFYFFFEITTLCSFLLIGHDKTQIAVKNALQALWMNNVGGVAFIIATVWIYQSLGTLDMNHIIHTSPKAGVCFLPIALLCLAGFTKAAQFPFQSWLLGAMVAPTPVSALLHSSTMVKAGVYLVLRLAPAFTGTFLSESVAIFGAFTFFAAAALAVGQSNGKRVLAYSTISNLGLIFACAGVNTPSAVTAAILIIIFHAISKALLFLCVGCIEQKIASRNIEDMRGLYAEMPITALITVLGVITMIMPPFGLLLGKWMAIESASKILLVIIMIALGSALTVMYWARWAGTLMSDPFAGRFKPERQPFLTWAALLALCGIAGVLSVASPWLYTRMIIPDYIAAYTVHSGIIENSFGAFAVIPLFLVSIFGLLISIWSVKSALRARVTPPYLSGIHTDTPCMFIGPKNQLVKAEARNYYLASIFGEEKLTTWINLGAGVLIILILGGALC